MGTCNFHSMDNFDLWAVGSSRFYAKCCPECSCSNDGDACEICGADLSDIEPEFDDLAEMFFYEDILEDLKEINTGLLFHEITIKSGYYEGLQLYVETLHYVHEYGNDDTRYHFDLCRSAAIRKHGAEQRRINKLLAKIGRAYGMDKLAIYARFSNGETWYTKAGA